MNISREIIYAGSLAIPCVVLTPPGPRGAAVVVHGYGGCKEEQLGLAWRIAETGVRVCAIDLRGHGEHTMSLDRNVLGDVEAAIQHCRALGKVAVIGHSLGGRLCLVSSGDFKIGISPALKPTYSPETQQLIDSMRRYRVRESVSGVNFEILKNLPVPHSMDNSRTLLLFGSRDVPEVVACCKELLANGNHVIEINKALHNDIFVLEETFGYVQKQLGEWFENEEIAGKK